MLMVLGARIYDIKFYAVSQIFDVWHQMFDFGLQYLIFGYKRFKEIDEDGCIPLKIREIYSSKQQDTRIGVIKILSKLKDRDRVDEL